jgi:hypothetical protein
MAESSCGGTPRRTAATLNSCSASTASSKEQNGPLCSCWQILQTIFHMRFSMPSDLGDAFCVLNAHGEVWTGDGWSADLSQARRYEGEPDPYSEALAACAAMGAGCVPLYLPPPAGARGDGYPPRKSTRPGARGNGSHPAGGLPTRYTE